MDKIWVKTLVHSKSPFISLWRWQTTTCSFFSIIIVSLQCNWLSLHWSESKNVPVSWPSPKPDPVKMPQSPWQDPDPLNSNDWDNISTTITAQQEGTLANWVVSDMLPGLSQHVPQSVATGQQEGWTQWRPLSKNNVVSSQQLSRFVLHDTDYHPGSSSCFRNPAKLSRKVEGA